MSTRARPPLLRTAAVALLAALGACGASPDDDGLSIAPASIEFGTVSHGDVVRRTLTLTNRTGRDVMILAVDKNCSCFYVDPAYRRTLAPGQSTDVHVDYVSGQAPPQVLRGKELTIKTDIPGAGPRKVGLKGESHAPWSLDRESIPFQAFKSASGPTPQTVKIRTRAGYTVKVVAAAPSNPRLLDVEVREVADGADAVLSLKPGAKGEGVVNENVVFKIQVTGHGVTARPYEPQVAIRGTW
jgi:hypothetical protein